MVGFKQSPHQRCMRGYWPSLFLQGRSPSFNKIYNRLLSPPCELGRIRSPTSGAFWGLFDEVDAASGALGDWRQDPNGNDASPVL